MTNKIQYKNMGKKVSQSSPAYNYVVPSQTAKTPDKGPKETSMYPTMKPPEKRDDRPYPSMPAQPLPTSQDLAPKGKGLTYSSMPQDGSAEAKEIIELAEAGRFDQWGNKLKEELRQMGATEKDFAMINYFQDVARESHDPGVDPELRGWALKMGRWVYDVKKQQQKNRDRGGKR